MLFCHMCGKEQDSMGPSHPHPCPLSASCVEKNLSFLGLPQVPKDNLNHRSEKIQKERKTDKIIIA